MRRLTAPLAVLVLVLAGCGGEDGDAARDAELRTELPAVAEDTGGTEEDGPGVEDVPAPEDPSAEEDPDDRGVAAGASVELVMEASDATAEMTSGGLSFVITAQGGALDGTDLMVLHGRFDNLVPAAEMQFDMGGLMEVLLAGESDPLVAAMLGDMFEEPWEIRMVDDATYMRVPMLTQMLGAGDDMWVRSEGGMDDEFAELSDLGDFDELLEVLDVLEAAEAVREEGTEAVRGVDTTHYVIELDELLASEHLGHSGPGAIGEIGEIEGQDISLWIDDAGLIRRMALVVSADDLDPTGLGGGQPDPFEGTSLRVTVEFFDLGEPVEVRAPDPADVIDEDELDPFGAGF